MIWYFIVSRIWWARDEKTEETKELQQMLSATVLKNMWCRSKLNCTKGGGGAESTSSKSSSTACGLFLFYCVPKTRSFYRNWTSVCPSRRISVPAAEAILAATFYLRRGICSSRISRPDGYSFWENWFSDLLSCQRLLCYADSSCEGSNRAVSEKRNFTKVNCSRLAGEDAGLLCLLDAGYTTH